MVSKASKPITIDADLFNELTEALSPSGGLTTDVRDSLHTRLMTVLLDDVCVDGDGSGLCESHSYTPMAYYTDAQGKLLKRGTFDPEDTGFPVCEYAQTYDERLHRKYDRE